VLTCDSIVLTVSKKFDLKAICSEGDGGTWLTVLDAVLMARMNQDPDDVAPAIWKAFLVYAFLLVPCIQSW
jgi:hypothetical protein